MEIPVLRDIVIIFGLSIAVLLVCHSLRIPQIVGLLVTGVLSGPYGMGLIQNPRVVEVFAEFGIVLLLFSIGVEFSLSQIFRFKQFFLIGGLQVLLTVCAGFVIASLLGRPTGESLFLGFLLAMSSTVIVFRLLESTSEITTSHGRLSAAILIFQDLIIVPLMLFIPVFSGQKVEAGLIWLLIKGLSLIAIVVILATKLVPRLFTFITRTESRELFLLFVLAICFGIAYLASQFGLSLAIGAFLAGLIISESGYWHQVYGDIRSLKDVFASFFFVSMGMLLDIHFVSQHFAFIFLIALGLMIMKTCTTSLAGILLGIPLRTVLLSAFCLCQVGEFSFVLVKAGQEYGLGTDFYYQLFLAVALLSMGFTPFIHNFSPVLADQLMRLPLSEKMKTGIKSIFTKEKKQYNHLVIVGFGACGKKLAESCKTEKISYIAIDMNSQTVAQEKKKQEPILYGDATHEVVLKAVSIEKAKALAICMVDQRSALRIISHARKLNPDLYIISRTRYVFDEAALYAHGANKVVADESSSGSEMTSNLLQDAKFD